MGSSALSPRETATLRQCRRGDSGRLTDHFRNALTSNQTDTEASSTSI